jgi:hypothetical protein
MQGPSVDAPRVPGERKRVCRDGRRQEGRPAHCGARRNSGPLCQVSWRHTLPHAVSDASVRVRHHRTVTYLVTSSLGRYWILFLAHNGKQGRHSRILVQHTGPFFRKVAYSTNL